MQFWQETSMKMSRLPIVGSCHALRFFFTVDSWLASLKKLAVESLLYILIQHLE
jgi:hypothetical protein